MDRALSSGGFGRRGTVELLLVAPLVLATVIGCSSHHVDLETAADYLAQELAARVPRTPGTYVAVSDLLTDGQPTRFGQRTADYIADSLYDRLGSIVVDRRDLEQQLAEHHFQWSDFAFEERIVAFGHKTPATVIVTGTIDWYGDDCDIRCRLLDLRTGRMLGRATYRFEAADEDAGDASGMPTARAEAPLRAPPVDRQLRLAAEKIAAKLVASVQRQNLTGLSIAIGRMQGPELPYESAYGIALLQFTQNELQKQGQEAELRLLARRDLDKVLEMQRIEHTPFFDENKRAPLDASEGAQATLYGHVEVVGQACQVTIELTDLETKAILHTDSLRVPYGEGQDELLRSLRPQ